MGLRDQADDLVVARDSVSAVSQMLNLGWVISSYTAYESGYGRVQSQCLSQHGVDVLEIFQMLNGHLAMAEDSVNFLLRFEQRLWVFQEPQSGERT